MKNLKRVLALVIALVFVMGTVAFADTTDTTTEPAAYAKAQDLLGQLNIMVGDENGNFNADKTITKGEAARIIYSLLVEMGGTLPGVDTVFSDVTSLYWGSGYINALNGASINGANVINGTGDGTFAPTKLLSYDEINTMLTIALGYQPYAKRNGGFPYGYRTAASKAKLYDNTFGTVTYGGSKGITRGEVAILVANALIANPMVPTGYSDDGTSYDFDDKTIFATSNCGLTMASGVARTAGSNFTIMTPATDDVDPTGLKAGDSKIKEAIGLNVIVFYNSGKTIEGMVVTGERASLASGTKFWFDGSKVSVDGEKTKYTVAKGAKLTVNGTEVSADNISDLVTKLTTLNSTLKATLYGSDTTANEVAVEIYSVGKVSNIYTSSNSVRINVEGTSKSFIVKKDNDTFTKEDGEAGTVKDMTVGSYVKVTPIVKDTKDASAIEAFNSNIVVAQSKLEDVTIKSKTSAGKYTIDGTAYGVNAKFSADYAELKVGSTGTVTLDANNNIVAFTATKEATNSYIGYITYASVLSGRNDKKISFDIVIDGKTLSYMTSDKYDATSGVAKTIYDALFANASDIINEEAIDSKYIATVTLDKDDNVTNIFFNAKDADTQTSMKFDKALLKLTETTSKKAIYLSNSSKVYLLSDKGVLTEKEVSYLTNGSTYTNVVLLKDSKNNEIGIVIMGSATTTTKATALAIGGVDIVSEDGTNYAYLKAYVNGEEVTLKGKETSELATKAAKGDYFSYEVDGDGLVTKVESIFKASELGAKLTPGEENAFTFEISSPKLVVAADGTVTTKGYATILKKSGVTITFTTDNITSETKKSAIDAMMDGESDATLDVSNNIKVYSYDVKGKTYAPGIVSDSFAASEIEYTGAATADSTVASNTYFRAMYVNVDADKNVSEIILFYNF